MATEEPKAVIVSVKIDWASETCEDARITFVTGEDPVRGAHRLIEDLIAADFPGYAHVVVGNGAAGAGRRSAYKDEEPSIWSALPEDSGSGRK
jgi:hypothetical protein